MTRPYRPRRYHAERYHRMHSAPIPAEYWISDEDQAKLRAEERTRRTVEQLAKSVGAKTR